MQEIKASPHLTELHQHLAVYISACDIADVFKQVKYKKLTTAEAKCRLLQAVSKFLELHKALYGTEHIKPKFAWLWLIALRMGDCEWFFDMFCIERQHQRARKQADTKKNKNQKKH